VIRKDGRCILAGTAAANRRTGHIAARVETRVRCSTLAGKSFHRTREHRHAT
jgi:hypothetical protein